MHATNIIFFLENNLLINKVSLRKKFGYNLYYESCLLQVFSDILEANDIFAITGSFDSREKSNSTKPQYRRRKDDCQSVSCSTNDAQPRFKARRSSKDIKK